MCTDITLPCMFTVIGVEKCKRASICTLPSLLLFLKEINTFPLSAMKTQSMNLLTQYNSSLKTLNAGIH